MKDDLISRADAIEAVERAVTKEVARWSIKELPPAQPNWFEAAIPPKDGEVYINENGCVIMGAKTFGEYSISQKEEREKL